MRQRTSYSSASICIVLVCSSIAGAGCRRDFTTQGDVLRERILELERENERLVLRSAELQAELQAAAARPASLPAEALAAQPRVAGIRIGRLSHVADTDEDGQPDLLRLYVTSRDGRGRFLQLVGSLSLNAAILPADAEAVTVARCTLDPIELRETYRSGIGGTHYTIECPLTYPAAAGVDAIDVRVTYRDATSGREHTASRSISTRLGPPRGRATSAGPRETRP